MIKKDELITYGLIILAIAGIGFAIYRFTDFGSNIIPGLRDRQEEKTEELDLPENWEVTLENTDEIVVKVSKQTEAEIITNVVLTKTEDVDYETPETYTDRLVSGTKNALPSLTYRKDEIEEDDYYIRRLSGSYWNGSDRVEINQWIYVGENTVYVLTASYDYNQQSEELTSEINQIFDLLVEKYL